MTDLIPSETICASCAFPVGALPWKMVEGRVYHEECVARTDGNDPTPPPSRPGESASERVEDLARSITNPGQERLG